jgi:hypothetical protein
VAVNLPESNNRLQIEFGIISLDATEDVFGSAPIRRKNLASISLLC